MFRTWPVLFANAMRFLAICDDVKMHHDKESNSSLCKMHSLWFLFFVYFVIFSSSKYSMCNIFFSPHSLSYFHFSLLCSSCLVKTIYLIKWRRAHNYIVQFVFCYRLSVNTQNMNCLFLLHEMHIRFFSVHLTAVCHNN